MDAAILNVKRNGYKPKPTIAQTLEPITIAEISKNIGSFCK